MKKNAVDCIGLSRFVFRIQITSKLLIYEDGERLLLGSTLQLSWCVLKSDPDPGRSVSKVNLSSRLAAFLSLIPTTNLLTKVLESQDSFELLKQLLQSCGIFPISTTYSHGGL